MALRETVERLRKTQVEAPSPADVIQAWQTEVDRLYATLSDWLRPLVDNGDIVLTRGTKAAYEDTLGPYDVAQLDIEVGDEIVRCDPRGRSWSVRAAASTSRFSVSRILRSSC